MTPEKVFKAGVQREPGWLYYFDSGNIMRVPMQRCGQKKTRRKPEVILKTDVKREDGFVYYLDRQGDVSRSVSLFQKMKFGRKAVKKPTPVNLKKLRADLAKIIGELADSDTNTQAIMDDLHWISSELKEGSREEASLRKLAKILPSLKKAVKEHKKSYAKLRQLASQEKFA